MQPDEHLKTNALQCYAKCFTRESKVIDLQERSGGVVLLIKAQPGARRSGIVGTHAGALKVAVSAAPENGKATAAIIELLAKELDLPRSNFQLLAGATSRQKQFLIGGIDLVELEKRILLKLKLDGD